MLVLRNSYTMNSWVVQLVQSPEQVQVSHVLQFSTGHILCLLASQANLQLLPHWLNDLSSINCRKAPTITARGNNITIDFSTNLTVEIYGHALHLITSNVMISGCLKHGCEEEAEIIFKEMDEKDVTTWNLMIQVYAQSDCIQQAISLFCELQGEGRKPDKVTIVSILPACVRLASAHLVRQCHGHTIRVSISDLHIDGALIDAYSKCGSINYTLKLFQTSLHKDLISFSAMIGGFAMHGMAEQALDIFSQMINLGIKPDHVIMTSLLSACSHAGPVDEGWKHFKAISTIHSMEPTIEHYACMVDLLARRGQL